MDNWNRKDQREYTGITAQRRNRRRPGTEPAQPGAGQEAPDLSAWRRPAAPAKPAEPVKAEEPVKEEPAIPAEPVKRVATFRSAYERPAAPVKAEEPVEPVNTEEAFRSIFERPKAPEKAEEPKKAEEPAEPVKAEEPVKPEEPAKATASFLEISYTPEKPGKTAEPAKPEEPAKVEPAAKPEKPAEPEEAAEKPAAEPERPAEEPPVVQGADSRVPPEARRMAASPYGAAGMARRPANLQAERKNAPRAEERREPARIRPDRTGGMTPPAGRARESQQKPRVRVGYAPGRMSGDMTQQVPIREAGREPAYNRDARAYLEKRKSPFQAEQPEERIPDYKDHETLRIVVLLMVIIGAVLTVILLQRGGGPNRKAPKVPPRVISFEAPETIGLTAPVDLTFSAQTEKDVDGIRLRGEGDRDLDTVAWFADNADGKHWMMKMSLESGLTGTVRLQVRRSGETEWYETDHEFLIDVTSPLGAPPAETEAPVLLDEDDDDYYNPDEEPAGEEPAEETGGQDVNPDAKAAEEPAQEPAAEPAGEPAEEPEDLWGEEDLPAGELKTPQPTDTPPPETPEPTATPALAAEAAAEASPDLITNTTVWTSFTKREKEYNRAAKELIHMPAGDEYTKKQLGVMTFRGDNFRRNAAVGRLSAAPEKLQVLWQAEAGSARGTNQTYYGYGWTGQPVIARWSTEVRSHSNITEAKQEKRALKEVIIAGLDGAIRFLDLEDGKITRNSIKLGYPMRGTPSLHPRGYPFMSVGQFARKMKAKTGKIGLRQYNLFTQGDMRLIDGLDGKYHRPLNNVGSFETSALVDRESDTLIAVGSNGMLYLESLGSTFDYNTGVMTISPSIVAMSSKAKGQKNTALMAVESSPAAYDKYVFYADMGGVLRCVDTNTLTPAWAVETGDSVMAAIALDMTEARELNLYTANMLNNRKKGDGDIQIRRYDALSGREIWTADVGVFKGKKDKTKDNVGAKASPVIGQHGLNDLVYFTVTGLSEDGRSRLGLANEEEAALIALDKETGKTAWAFGLSSRSESSPIALYDEQGNGWILQCEQDGTVHLLEGLTGREISSLELEAEIEASPAAYNNVVVIGTTGKGTSFVYAIEVKLEGSPDSGAEQGEDGEAPEEPENAEAAPAEDGEAESEEPEEPEWPEEAEEEPEEEPEWPEEEGGTENEENPGGA